MATQVISNIMSQAPKIPLGNADYWEKNINVEEIKNLLMDQNNEKKVMEGLKLIIAAMSRGRNVAEVFPDVVKLIASQNVEVKKMVYIYLVHYAEVEPNTSLLAISILKKNSSSTNQLIRAHALRTISGIRVKMIIQVVVSTISGGTKDSSPYVRKTSAHAIPKVFCLDPSQKELLVECIEKLLKDKSTMVLGSALFAFNEVCPDRWDLIHPQYRKFCEALADIDEWGQVSVLHMLTRYGRTQFMDPDRPKEKVEEKKEEEENEDDDYYKDFEFAAGASGFSNIEPDHRLLLDAALPLLKSRNAAVVQAVGTLYYYLAPDAEKNKIAKSMIRLIRGTREVQYSSLACISSMVQTHPGIFQPYLSDFFVEGTDPTFTRNIKLEIMTQLANETNIDRVLREFTYYTQQEDKEFVAYTIQCIGKCAMRLPEVTERCMMQLLQLLSSKSEAVVAESVVVIKQLLQMPPPEKREDDEDDENSHANQQDDVIKRLTLLFDKVTNPKAKASIIWVVGEYVDKVSAYAPDILRQLAKEFAKSDVVVKVQILNLAAKLMLTNPDQTALIVQYILTLAKYDQNYDIRDKCRLLRLILLDPNGKMKLLNENAKRLFITKKPSPVISSSDTKRYAIGTLSHIVNHTAPGYQPIPDWATEPSDPELRRPLEPLGPPPSTRDDYSSGAFVPPAAWKAGGAEENYNDLDSFLGGNDGDYNNGDYSEEYGQYDEEYSQYGEEEYNEDYGQYGEEYNEDYGQYGEEYNYAEEEWGQQEESSFYENNSGQYEEYNEEYGSEEYWDSFEAGTENTEETPKEVEKAEGNEGNTEGVTEENEGNTEENQPKEEEKTNGNLKEKKEDNEKTTDNSNADVVLGEASEDEIQQ